MSLAYKSISQKKIEFQNTKIGYIPIDWDIVHLKNVAGIYFSNVDKLTNEYEIPVLLCNYLDVYRNTFIVKDLPFMPATAKEREIDKFQLKKWDVIITKDSETQDDIAVPAVVIEDLVNVICGYHLAIIRGFEKRLYGMFLMYLLNSPNVNNEFTKLANGVTRYGLNTTSVQNALIPLPPLPEQQKIAKILSTWDEAIALTEKLIAAKEKLKKGLMQQLLTGKKRFEEFVISNETHETKIGHFPIDWRIVTLNEVSDILFSNVDKKSSPDEQSVYLCNYLDVYYNNFITENLPFMKATASENETNRFKLKKLDVIITKDSETQDDIGMPAVVTDDLQSVICGYHLSIIRGRKQILHGIFLMYLLSSERINHQLARLANGITRFGLNTSSVQNALIPLPSYQEQLKLASVFANLDQEIQLLQNKLQALQKQKKGLMQQLLTGKVRVQVED